MPQPLDDAAARRIDKLDSEILRALSDDPQAPNTRLAGRLGVSEMKIASRIDRLIADGMMKITIQRDVRTLGYLVFGIVEVTVDGADVAGVAARIRDLPNVFSITTVVGDPQLLILLMARDTKHLVRTVEADIGTLDGIKAAVTSIILDVVTFKSGIAVF